MREHLNSIMMNFDRYGNLNEKQNVKFILMDANGRDSLALERGENGHFVKADIFDHRYHLPLMRLHQLIPRWRH